MKKLGIPLACPQPQRFFLHPVWTPSLGEMLSLLRCWGRCLDLGFAQEDDLALCGSGLASSAAALTLQHRVSKLLWELRGPADLVHSYPE